MNHEMKDRTNIYTGNANIPLATEIVGQLRTSLAPRELSHFSDAEIRCEILSHVRDSYAFIIQSTSSPANDHLMEILIMTDALKRQGVNKIVAVIPYYGYARQDRKPSFNRAPITSKLVANMLETAGVTTVVTVDIHSEQQLGFFEIPVINISASPELIGDIWVNHSREEPITIISPDAGGVERARVVAKQLNAELAIIDKRRPKANVAEVMHVIGDVEGRRCIIIDDMIDTAGTLCKSAKALKENGAAYVAAYATHPVLSGSAYHNIQTSELDEVVVTDTIEINSFIDTFKIRQISVAKLLAETIYRIREEESISEIYIGA